MQPWLASPVCVAKDVGRSHAGVSRGKKPAAPLISLLCGTRVRKSMEAMKAHSQMTEEEKKKMKVMT
jgi:hypothetical protein